MYGWLGVFVVCWARINCLNYNDIVTLRVRSLKCGLISAKRVAEHIWNVIFYENITQVLI